MSVSWLAGGSRQRPRFRSTLVASPGPLCPSYQSLHADYSIVYLCLCTARRMASSLLGLVHRGNSNCPSLSGTCREQEAVSMLPTRATVPPTCLAAYFPRNSCKLSQVILEQHIYAIDTYTRWRADMMAACGCGVPGRMACPEPRHLLMPDRSVPKIPRPQHILDTALRSERHRLRWMRAKALELPADAPPAPSVSSWVTGQGVADTAAVDVEVLRANALRLRSAYEPDIRAEIKVRARSCPGLIGICGSVSACERGFFKAGEMRACTVSS